MKNSEIDLKIVELKAQAKKAVEDFNLDLAEKLHNEISDLELKSAINLYEEVKNTYEILVLVREVQLKDSSEYNKKIEDIKQEKNKIEKFLSKNK